MIDLLKQTLKVPLKFHWSALILPLLLMYNFGPVGLIYWIMLMVGLLFHEYGHVYEAIRQGIGAKYVVVHMLGGLDELNGMPIEQPKKEIWMALAGPVASLLLAAFTLPFVMLTANPYVAVFFAINIIFCLFNLIPAYPADGGRILNGILAMFFGYRKAIGISFVITCIICAFGLIYAIVASHIWLGMISVLVVFLAYASKKAVEKQLDAVNY
jgi:stage IV sporulation protein FB